MYKDTIHLCLAEAQVFAPNTAKQSFSEDGELSPYPEKDDFIEFPFRQISATIVGSGTYKSTDFSNANVLKSSMALLDGVTAYTDHNDYSVKGNIGKVGKPKWTESYLSQNGTLIPAGINAPFVIDSKIHTKLCRMIAAGAINACSVAVEFEFKPSHEFSDERTFRENIGQMIDGREVTRVVTKILRYYESSLVTYPADKFAKNNQLPLNEGEQQKDVEFSVFESAKIEKVNFSLYDKKEKKMKIAFINNNGERVESEWKENFVAIDTEHFNSLKTELDTAKAQLTAKDNEIVQLQKDLLPLTEILQAKKDRAKTLYETFSNGKPNELLLQDIEKADNNKLDALIETYGGKVAESLGFGLCKDCNSTNIEFRSTQPQEDSKKEITTTRVSLRDKIL